MLFSVYADFQATEAVQGIASGRMGVHNKTLALSADAFLKMKRLRVLRVFNAPTPNSRDLNYLSNELRLLEWHGYPFKSFPSTFHPENLVALLLPYSRIQKLWKPSTPLPMLRSVDLKGCENLVKTPDFSMVPNLESLVLEGTRIADFHPSLMFLRRLKIFSLKDCKSVRSFPSKIGNESLETLILSGCSKLRRIPETVEEMECLRELCLDGTAIKELPSSVGHLRSLELLTLDGCSKLETLPNSIGGCQLLENLNLCGCSKLENLPENLQQIKSLKRLDLSETAITALPAFIFHMKSLEWLSFKGCKGPPSRGRSHWPFVSRATERLDTNSMTLRLPAIFPGLTTLNSLLLDDCNLLDGAIPNGISSLSSLSYLSLSDNNFITLPTTLGRLSKLTFLILTDCKRLKSLPDLPANVRLSVDGCASLEEVPIPTTVCNYPSSYGYINALSCFKLAETNDVITMLKRSLKVVAKERTGNFSIFIPGSEIPPWFSYQTDESSNSIIKMPLPPNFLNDCQILGFAFCFVFSSNFDYDPGRLDFINFKSTIHGRNFSCKVGGIRYHLEAGSRRVTEDHRWLYFMPFDEMDLTSLEELICNEAEISGSTIDMAKERFEMEVEFIIDNIGSKAKKCGARILYEKDLEEMDEAIDEHSRPTSDDSHSNDGSTGNNIALPAFIFHMKSLEWLSFKGCKGPPSRGRSHWPSISRATERLGANSMTLRLPAVLSGLSTLNELYLDDCNLCDGVIPNCISSLWSLACLSLSDNNFITLPTTLGQLSKLTYLILTDCKRLKSLPDLPANIRLMVDGCASLEAVPISTTVCNYPRSYGYIYALSCFKLAETNNVITMLKTSLKVAALQENNIMVINAANCHLLCFVS
ncbi:hypothetical protein V6N12_054615 [Hibiscus sabdariffa]|uniref:Uncharacterized protein n=1 Tax=Hibiscus sabdariffa TaxID=183260 RepID=A0ABR2D0Z1_9ROSI